MEKVKLPVGYIAYEATAAETYLLGGCGICDECGHFSAKGYLVPVLNHFQCPGCFGKWGLAAKFYPEDLPAEQQRIDYYERMIPLAF